MINKRQYVKPIALNLSGLAVIGYEPLGTCQNGYDPTTAFCTGGDAVDQRPTACNPNGLSPEIGGCSVGGNVSSSCNSGATIWE